ncbi:MAG: energy transducer TonB [Candidatus Acidiferrales bacterium]
MSTLSKETIELAHLETESAPPDALLNSQALPAPGQLHSDAVSLEVSIRIHGSRVTDAVRGAAAHPEPFEEQTTSMIVFPNGGVLRMSTSVNVGQMLVLTHLKSRQDAICRVKKIRSYSSSSSYVEVEFTHRQPGYWGVHFASDDSAPKVTAPSAPEGTSGSNGNGPNVVGASPSRSASPKSVVTTVGGPPANSPATKPESTFAPIGVHEDVQPSASMTAGSTGIAEITGAPMALPSKIEKPAAVSQVQKHAVADVQTPPLTNILTVTEFSVAEETLSDVPRPNAPSLNAVQSPRNSGQLFGVQLESKGSERQGSATAKNKNWMLIAACVAGLLVVAGGGYLLLHHRSGDLAVNPATSMVAHTQAMPPVATQSAPATSPAQINLKRSLDPVSSARENPAVNASDAKDTAVSASQTEDPAQSAQPGNSAPAKSTVPSMFGALNAHPVSTRESVQAPTAAPAVDSGGASPGENDVLPGITAGSSSVLAPPAFRPTGPVPVGGPVKEPRVVSRVLPAYPPLARQAHTEGDVVLDIVVDKSGNVNAMRVISGAPTLRQAATDAVRRWKYQPTMLDGQPISVQMQVTIQFRL